MQLPADRVVVITRSESWQSLGRLQELDPGIGGVELRLDLWRPDPSITALPGDLSVIVTDRGGLGDAIRSARRDEICRSLGAILDVDPLTDAPAPPDLDWIFSSHRTEQLEISPAQLVLQAQRRGASAAKIVFSSDDLEQSRAAIELAKGFPDFPVISFCSGAASVVDRLVALDDGQPWGYVRPADDETDEVLNVPTIDDIRQRYRTCDRVAHRRWFAVLGADVRESPSPGWHNRLLDDSGSTDRLVQYSTLKPDLFLQTDPQLQFEGLVVTSPYKIWARQVAEPIDQQASWMPSWNTLIRYESGRWYGTSTDGIAAANLLEPIIRPGSVAVILGNGATAQVVAAALRGHMKVQMLALDPAQVPEQYRADDEDAAIAAADVLIHATDSARIPFDELCRDPSQFSGQVLMELGYRRCRSGFLQQLNARHKIDGWDFFSEQARCQAKLLHRIDVSQEQSRQLTSHCRREWGLQHDPCASQR